jgi:hypothetical protein
MKSVCGIAGNMNRILKEELLLAIVPSFIILVFRLKHKIPDKEVHSRQ